MMNMDKKECPHALKHLQAPCGCCVDHPSQVMMLVTEPTEEHLALHREAEAGIIHPYDEGMVKIPIPQLVINEKLLKQKLSK